jgi:hypothetical protein
MSCSPFIVKIPLALAVTVALGSGSAAWAQTSPGFKVLLGDLAPLDIAQSGVDANALPVFVRFEPSSRALKLTAGDPLLCFDFTPALEVPPSEKLRFDLSLPSGSNEILEGVSTAAISAGQVDEHKLVFIAPTAALNCYSFPREDLAQLETDKTQRAAGNQPEVFKSSFNRTEALPALALEVRDPLRTPAGSPSPSPQVGDTIQYTVRVSILNRGASAMGAVEQVRIRDYVPAVSTSGEALGLSQSVELTECSINGVVQETVLDPFDPESPLVPSCTRDAKGFLRFNDYPDAAPGLAMPAGSYVDFELQRTVVSAPGSSGGSEVYVIAAASASAESGNLGSLEDAFHVFTFS